jgi:hypothetical protein
MRIRAGLCFPCHVISRKTDPSKILGPFNVQKVPENKIYAKIGNLVL